MFRTKKKEKGQGLVEYALILVLVAVVVLAVLLILGPIIGNVFSDVNSTLASGSGGSSAGATALCAHYGWPSGRTVGPYANGIVLMTTTGGFGPATLNANDPAMEDPASSYYHPTIHATIPAGETSSCP